MLAQVVEVVIKLKLWFLIKIIKRSRHLHRPTGGGRVLLPVASRQTASRPRASTLEGVLTILRLELLSKVDLEVVAAVAVPVLLAIDIVANAKVQRLCLQVGGIRQLDGEGEAILADAGDEGADLVAKLSNHLRSRLPVVQCESAYNSLVEGHVGNNNRAHHRLLIRREPDLFDTDRLLSSLGGVMGKVVHHQLPIKWRRSSNGSPFLTSREGILNIAFIILHWRRACTDGKRPVDLKEVADVLQMGVKVNGLGEYRGTRHARGPLEAPQSRSDQFTRLLAYHGRLRPHVIFRVL